MSKRPYYLITHLVDCDGYNHYIDYLGINASAAIERFKFLVEELKERYFYNDGIENIYYGGEGEGAYENLSIADIDSIGKAFAVNLNDDNTCWVTVTISVLETGEFFNYPRTGRWATGRDIWTDNQARETIYKQNHPNAKY